MDTTNPQNTTDAEKAILYLAAVRNSLDKGHYNNALAWALDLAKELQRLHAEQVRLNMRPKRVR